MVSLLTVGLVERGLDVTLFATKATPTKAELVGVVLALADELVDLCLKKPRPPL